MCGIAGFIDRDKSIGDLQLMTRCLDHRGPDDEGYFFEDGVGLGHKRLSIIDLSEAGHQPMFYENLVTILNGEIYNYREVKELLQKKGYTFTSSSDTEVIIKAFHCWKEKCVDHFIGMYAFVIYDKQDKSLYLFRDRVGVKPLYYFHSRGRFAFASELRAFKNYLNPAERNELDSESLSSFFRVGYISNNRSLIKNVLKLPPGHFLRHKNGEIEICRYWSVSFEEDQSLSDKPEDEILDELESLAVSAFKYRMVADVPVGVFLSAGIDSSLVAAILSKHYGQIHTFTIGFAEKSFDESADAKRIASHLKTVHTEAVLTPETGQKIISQYYNIFDEPHGDNSGVPTTFVSSIAKKNGMKVVLSADGGDELFGGYARYPAYIDRWNQLKKKGKLAQAFAKGSIKLAGKFSYKDGAFRLDRFSSIMNQKDFASFYQMILRPNSDKELSELVKGYKNRFDTVSASNLYNQMMEWDFYHYLPDNNLVKVDRATMYNNIEGREPFLDHRLIEFAARLPLRYKINGDVTKYLLKKLLGRYLPKELYDLPKRGFSAPIQQWLRNNYEKDIADIFDPKAFENPYLNREAVLEFISRYKQRKKVNMVTLWFLYSFQKWYNKWTS